MLASPKPVDEERRVAALHALQILDTESEERFDRITRLAQRLFGTSMVTVSLVDSDRVWFKSALGIEGDEDLREISFCPYAILEPGTTMVVEDASADARFAANPRVTGDPWFASTPAIRWRRRGASRWAPSAWSTTPATPPSSTRDLRNWRRWPKRRSPRSRWRSATS